MRMAGIWALALLLYAAAVYLAWYLFVRVAP